MKVKILFVVCIISSFAYTANKRKVEKAKLFSEIIYQDIKAFSVLYPEYFGIINEHPESIVILNIVEEKILNFKFYKLNVNLNKSILYTLDSNELNNLNFNLIEYENKFYKVDGFGINEFYIFLNSYGFEPIKFKEMRQILKTISINQIKIDKSTYKRILSYEINADLFSFRNNYISYKMYNSKKLTGPIFLKELKNPGVDL